MVNVKPIAAGWHKKFYKETIDRLCANDYSRGINEAFCFWKQINQVNPLIPLVIKKLVQEKFIRSIDD